MNDASSGKKNSTPFVVYLPLIVLAIVWFQNQKDEEQRSDPAPAPSQVTEGQAEQQIPSVDETKPPSETEDYLTENSPDVFVSPAGLVYRSGSTHGHRLKHVMQHAEDDLSKPIHGVFIGSQTDILLLIDEAYELAQERGPPDVEQKQERGRTVITVNLKRKIGYTGGQAGQRDNQPPCHTLKLVLEDKNVITAYPVK